MGSTLASYRGCLHAGCLVPREQRPGRAEETFRAGVGPGSQASLKAGVRLGQAGRLARAFSQGGAVLPEQLPAKDRRMGRIRHAGTQTMALGGAEGCLCSRT